MRARLRAAVGHLGPHIRNTFFSILASKRSAMKQCLEARFSAFGPGIKPN